MYGWIAFAFLLGLVVGYALSSVTWIRLLKRAGARGPSSAASRVGVGERITTILHPEKGPDRVIRNR